MRLSTINTMRMYECATHGGEVTIGYITRQLGSRSLLLLALLLTSGITVAMPIDRGADERQQFTAAIAAIDRGDEATFQQLSARLQDYLLYPYLQYEWLSRRLDRIDDAAIDTFLTRYAATPLAARLRRLWLQQLARQQRWSPFLAHYRNGMGTTLRCYAGRAALATGDWRRAWREAAALWQSGSSQPAACDPLFAAWREAGGQNRQQLLARIELALDANETKLVDYLQRRLPAADQKLIDLRQLILRQPAAKLSQLRPYADQAWAAATFTEALVRIADERADDALTLWRTEQQRPHYRLSSKQRLRIERQIALHSAFQRHPEAAARLQAVQQLVPADKSVAEWRVRAALWQQQWPAVLAAIDALPKQLQRESEWVYWRARAEAQLGRAQQAKQHYQQIANCRCFYGFLAAEQLGQSPRFNHHQLEVDPREQAAIALRPETQRAFELVQLARFEDARREWRQLLQSLSATELRAAARLASDWGWHDQAILTIGKVGPYNDLELRFPIPFRDLIVPSASQQRLEPALVYALIRQESAFHPQARSHVGALGLTQMMPPTARRTANRLGERLDSHYQLLEPTTSVHLGTAHLRHLLNDFSDNLLFTLAAYNAGPHRIPQWLPEERAVPGDIWVAALTFYETRRYIQHILAYQQIYRWRLGVEPVSLLTQLEAIEPASTTQVRRTVGGVEGSG